MIKLGGGDKVLLPTKYGEAMLDVRICIVPGARTRANPANLTNSLQNGRVSMNSFPNMSCGHQEVETFSLSLAVTCCARVTQRLLVSSSPVSHLEKKSGARKAKNHVFSCHVFN